MTMLATVGVAAAGALTWAVRLLMRLDNTAQTADDRVDGIERSTNERHLQNRLDLARMDAAVTLVMRDHATLKNDMEWIKQALRDLMGRPTPRALLRKDDTNE